MLPSGGTRAVTLGEVVAAIERRAAEAEREGATAPVANVYRLVLVELRAVNGTAAAIPCNCAAALGFGGSGQLGGCIATLSRSPRGVGKHDAS